MIKTMHLAAQYLAAAGINFVEHKADDSHTSLLFISSNGTLNTFPLNENEDTLSLNYKTFSLEWNSTNATVSYGLHGKTHAETLAWLKSQALNAGITKPYAYSFHYDLPYTITDDFVYQLEESQLKNLLDARILAQSSIASFLLENKIDSDARVWPHHFDTGSYVPNFDEDKNAIGFGLAIPDTVQDSFYFYLVMYDANGSVDTSSFEPLEFGIWKKEGFKGAVLPITDAKDEETVVTFLNQALKTYKKQ